MTDKQLQKMEKKLKKIYKKASRDLFNQFNAYMAEVGPIVEGLEYEIQRNKMLGKSTTRAEELLRQKKQEITLQSYRYQQMVQNLTRELSDVNISALAYVDGELPSIYRVNYNQKPDYKLAFNFNLVDEHTIARRIEEGDIKLPKKKIDIPKDMRWNTRQLNSSVLQGILNGESMKKIARRIVPITNRNEVSAIRNARTMVTGAENQGRQDRYKDLGNQGMILHKVWIATGDSRTRHWHRTLDGQEVDINDYFIDGNGNELEYPGDPNAAPETVWNCRCSMRSEVIGYRKADGGISYV